MADGDGGEAATFTQADVERMVAEQVAGLKGKNQELLGKLKSAQELASQFEGLDPEKARKALDAATKAEAEKAKAAGDWDAREKQLRESFTAEHSKVVEPLQKRVTELESGLFSAVAERDAIEACSLAEVKGRPKILLPIIRSELGVEVIDGKMTTVVKGPDGKARYHQTTGQPFTVADRLKELRALPDYAGAFEGTGASGGGAEGGRGGANGVTTIRGGDDKSFLANIDKIAKGEVKVAS